MTYDPMDFTDEQVKVTKPFVLTTYRRVRMAGEDTDNPLGGDPKPHDPWLDDSIPVLKLLVVAGAVAAAILALGALA